MVSRACPASPLTLGTVTGDLDLKDFVQFKTPYFGQLEAYHAKDSADVFSLGKLLSTGNFEFRWSSQDYRPPRMVTLPTGAEVPSRCRATAP